MTELIELPDGSVMEGPLLGEQMPRFWTCPPRHTEIEDNCPACALEDYPTGCGEYTSNDILPWAENYGYDLDPWQDWSLRNILGAKPNGRWAAGTCCLIVSRQNGKGDRPLTEALYTSRGWTTYGGIRIGDEVLGADGKFTKVLYISPVFTGRDCYELEFSDGVKLLASQYHLWHVLNISSRKWENVSTEDLVNGTGTKAVGKVRPDNGRMEYYWRVRCDAVPELPEADLPVDPYLMGYWLGDGTSGEASITIGTADYAWTVNRLYEASARKPSRTGDANQRPEGILRPSATGHLRYLLRFRLSDATYGDSFETRARRLDCWKRKRIPEVYLTASIAQRKALLAGLMDSDGSIQANNKAPQCEFSTSNPELAEGFHRLARSLGIRVAPKWRKTAKKDNCRFLFTAPFNPFEMPRKAEVWKPPASKRHELMSIVAIRPVESVPTRCIKIANPDGVYLTGKHFTPTHNTILEVRELGGLYVLGEESLIHTAHEFKTAMKHFERLKTTINSYSGLRKRIKRIAGSHGSESIELIAKPTIITGSSGKQITRRYSPKLEFLARSKGSGRGFSCECLVYDEDMYLTADQVGASLPAMSARVMKSVARTGVQVIYAGSAGTEESEQEGKLRARITRGDKKMFGAEWSIHNHTDACPRDVARGRKTNYYIICDNPLHDDRDDPRAWAKANPALGYRLGYEYTRDEEFLNLPSDEFDKERLGIGRWPVEGASWAVVSEEAWEKLSLEDPGKPLRPIAFAFDIDEDGKSATISAAWAWQPTQVTEHIAKAAGITKRIVLEIPRGCSAPGSEWVLERADAMYRKWHPVAIGIPKNGPAAALIEDGKKLWRERCVPIGTADEAAAFAWFMQQIRQEGLWHFGQQKAPTLWHAMGNAETRIIGDGGKSFSRRDSESDITPVTSAMIAAYVLNTKATGYDPLKTIG